MEVDGVTVPYFKTLAKRIVKKDDKLSEIKLLDLTDPLKVVPLIRRCSKWVKKNIFIYDVAKYIIEKYVLNLTTRVVAKSDDMSTSHSSSNGTNESYCSSK